MECPDEYSIVALVRESFGIALMPRTDILELSQGVCIHPIENLDIYHQIFMFWMKERYRLPAVERFIEYMKQQARQDGLQAERETDSKNVLKIYLKNIVNFLSKTVMIKVSQHRDASHAMEKENFHHEEQIPENF